MLVAPVAGHAPQANILRLDFYRVKQKHVTEFETAGREFAALLRDARAPHAFSVWRSESGEREFLRIDASSDYTELCANPIGEDTAADQTRPVAAIDSHIENTRRLIVRVISGASQPFDTDLPAMITITWMRSRLGKGGEFQTLAKSDLLPLMKAAGMKLFLRCTDCVLRPQLRLRNLHNVGKLGGARRPWAFDVDGRRSVPALLHQKECVDGEPRGECVSVL